MRTIILFLLGFPLMLFAQDHLIRLNYDNDFFSATDQYYTQGVRLEYIAPVFGQSPIRHLLLATKNASSVYAGVAIERDGFTPSGIRIVGIPYGDRPYAGTMFVSPFSIAFNQKKQTRIFSQLDLGMMGPIVGGKEEQTSIHKTIGNILPLGWEYQIANDVIVNYTTQFEKGVFNREHITLTGFIQGRIGTLYTDASVGTMLRVGWMNDYFSNLGITKGLDSRKFQLYGFAKGSGKVVGYNATMQGGLFSESIYTLPASSINRTVAQGSYGVVIAYKRFQLEYTKHYITPEYKNGLTHGWGHCNISFCF
ncbi:MAG: lipid A deacylase LpxR family protein [Bacteroidota bacterium]